MPFLSHLAVLFSLRFQNELYINIEHIVGDKFERFSEMLMQINYFRLQNLAKSAIDSAVELV